MMPGRNLCSNMKMSTLFTPETKHVERRPQKWRHTQAECCALKLDQSLNRKLLFWLCGRPNTDPRYYTAGGDNMPNTDLNWDQGKQRPQKHFCQNIHWTMFCSFKVTIPTEGGGGGDGGMFVTVPPPFRWDYLRNEETMCRRFESQILFCPHLISAAQQFRRNLPDYNRIKSLGSFTEDPCSAVWHQPS